RPQVRREVTEKAKGKLVALLATVEERHAGLVRRMRHIRRRADDPVEALRRDRREQIPGAHVDRELVERGVEARQGDGALADVGRDDAAGAAARRAEPARARTGPPL